MAFLIYIKIIKKGLYKSFIDFEIRHQRSIFRGLYPYVRSRPRWETPCTPTAVENNRTSTSMRYVSRARSLLKHVTTIYRARSIRAPLNMCARTEGHIYF